MTRCHFVAKWRSLGNNGGKLITFLRNMGLSGTKHVRTYVHSSLLTFGGQCMAFAALVIFLCPWTINAGRLCQMVCTCLLCISTAQCSFLRLLWDQRRASGPVRAYLRSLPSPFSIVRSQMLGEGSRSALVVVVHVNVFIRHRWRLGSCRGFAKQLHLPAKMFFRPKSAHVSILLSFTKRACLGGVGTNVGLHYW